MVLIDTDILIWYLRGNLKAYDLLERQNGFFISVVTYIELVQGMRNKNELMELRKALNKWNAKVLFITEDISAKAMFFVEQNYLSNSMMLADALIASTAIATGLKLLTGNIKHYRVLKELELEKFNP